MTLPAVVLYQPEIPPNSGNIIRLCANTGAALHFIHPLGFRLDDRDLRRAGLDYAEFADIHEHNSLEEYRITIRPQRLFVFSASGETLYDTVSPRAGDALVFGGETRGLPAEVLAAVPPGQRLRIPMRAESRSMNLANSVAVAIYEAWRQQGFATGE